MSTLAKLKLVSVTAERKSPTILRRNKLTGKIDHQLAYARAAIAGENYAAKRVKFVQDGESGERKQVEISTRVKPWWFTGPNGKLVLALRYGAKPIEIAKGKNAVELTDMDDLVATLEVIKGAVHAGELDSQIEQASGSLRAGFTKKK
tara:strand:- start:321 stop:764 length:444 start_codon:yes stop_codon:yes gene_type:complete